MDCIRRELAVKQISIVLDIAFVTYSGPRFIAASTKNLCAQLPGIVITKRSANCLGYLWRSDEEVGMECGRQMQDPRESSCDPVDPRKQRRVYSRS